jgi:hypothetical protein
MPGIFLPAALPAHTFDIAWHIRRADQGIRLSAAIIEAAVGLQSIRPSLCHQRFPIRHLAAFNALPDFSPF